MFNPRLALRIDEVAFLRQARRSRIPDPVMVAYASQMAGVDMISHGFRVSNSALVKRDLQLLRQTLTVPLNLEIAASQELLRTAYEIKPDLVTIVPDSGDEISPAEGIDIMRSREQLKSFVQSLRDGDIKAGILLEPNLDQVRNAHRIDVQFVMIYARKLAEASNEQERQGELEHIVDVAKTCARLGLEVMVGGGLSYNDLRLLAPIEEIAVLHIGHSLLARAIFVGIERAIAECLEAMRDGPKR
jgi:pyridoxine 5-phosphate synthase